MNDDLKFYGSIIMLFVFSILLGILWTQNYYHKKLVDYELNNLLSIEKTINFCKSKYNQELQIKRDSYPIIEFVEVKDEKIVN